MEGKTLEVEGKAIPHIDILLYGAMNYGVITTKVSLLASMYLFLDRVAHIILGDLFLQKIRASAKKEVNWSRVCGELFPMNDDDDFDFVDVYWNPMISCWNEFNFEYVKFTEAGNPGKSIFQEILFHHHAMAPNLLAHVSRPLVPTLIVLFLF